MDIKVLLQALNHPWFIEPKSADHYALMLHKLFVSESSSLFSDDEEKIREFAWAVDIRGKRIGTIEDAVNIGVGVINMRGAVMKYDYCGTPGTQSLMKALQQANDNPSLSAIVLQIDSPGGSVDGTQQFANAIKSSKKPVVAYINGMMCSAAMWIGSAASERIASSNTDVIGSIGTMARWSDFKGYREKMGIKSHEVYATASTHKNLDFREANNGNYEPLITTWLDPLNNEFTGTIESNLPKADNTVLNGSSFIAKEAKKKGLIDKIGSFETAVRSALQLSKQNSIVNNMKSAEIKIAAFEKVLAAATAEKFEVVDGGFLLEETHLNAIEASLSAAEAKEIQLNGEISSLTEQLGTKAIDIAAANTARDANAARVIVLEAEIVTLKNSAPDFVQTVKEGTDLLPGAKVVDKKTKYRTAYDEQAESYAK